MAENYAESGEGERHEVRRPNPSVERRVFQGAVKQVFGQNDEKKQGHSGQTTPGAEKKDPQLSQANRQEDSKCLKKMGEKRDGAHPMKEEGWRGLNHVGTRGEKVGQSS